MTWWVDGWIARTLGSRGVEASVSTLTILVTDSLERGGWTERSPDPRGEASVSAMTVLVIGSQQGVSAAFARLSW